MQCEFSHLFCPINDKETKKSLAALEKEYNLCREELKVVQEEKERYKTHSKDLESIINLSNPSKVIESTNKSSNELAVCEECEYPCRTKTDLSIHQQKHQLNINNIEINQICSLCEIDCISNDELRKHINVKHSSQFNCNDSAFQAS